MPVLPSSALIAMPEISVSIVNSAVETDFRSPVAIIEKISVVSPAPVPWSPQEARFRSHHPLARYPVIVITISPISGRPEITVPRTNWLLVNGHHRWRDPHGYAQLRECRPRQQYHSHCNQ